MNIQDVINIVKKASQGINKKNISIILVVLIVIFLLGFWLWQSSRPGELDVFAKCLKEKGAKFYGAFWCPHCQNQKTMFGSSKKYLPYIECSTPDGNNQLQVCSDAKVQGYPTWEFSDGSREVGELSLDALSKKSDCQVPSS